MINVMRSEENSFIIYLLKNMLRYSPIFSFFRLEKILDRGKETERIYINLGLLAVNNQNFLSAEKWFRKALQVRFLQNDFWNINLFRHENKIMSLVYS